MSTDDSVFIAHEPCPQCGSRDNLARYSDGHGHCFGCNHFEKGDGQAGDSENAFDATGREATPGRRFEPLDGTISSIPKRGLSEETCRIWDYRLGETSRGEPCHIANYRDTSRTLVAQKLRDASKKFPILKDKGTKLPLYGMWLWPNDRRSIIITEGELDALSVSQAQGHKYPVVSLPLGSGDAPNAIKLHYDWLCEFQKIVLMFDSDEPGQKAAQECAEILPPGKVFVADLGEYKDANEALAAGKPGAITSAFWGAKLFQPDGIFTLSDIREDVLKPVEWGRPWFLPSVTEWTFGRRDGELYFFGAGTGIGKTDFFTQQIAYDVIELGVMTAVIYLEQPPVETGKRIAGKVAGRAFHVPDGSWTQEELLETVDRLEKTGKLLLGGKFAAVEWKQIKARIRFMAHAHGVKHVYLDHLTALADPSNERESLEIITKDLAMLCQELGIVMHVISHLSTPDGKPHEEGGRVMLRHFKGSRSIGFWGHFAFGLERNPQDEDREEAQKTVFRCIKDRYTGRANGKTLTLTYDQSNGLISESSFTDAF